MRFPYTSIVAITVIICCLFILAFHSSLDEKETNKYEQRSSLRGFADEVKRKELTTNTVLEIQPDIEIDSASEKVYTSHPSVVQVVTEAATSIPTTNNYVFSNITLFSDPIAPAEVSFHNEVLTEVLVANDSLHQVTTLDLVDGSPIVNQERWTRLPVKINIRINKHKKDSFTKLSSGYYNVGSVLSSSTAHKENFFLSKKEANMEQTYNFRVLERFHRALNTGNACPLLSTPEYADSSHVALVQSVTDLLKSSNAKVVIEFENKEVSKKSLAYSAASTVPSLTALYVSDGSAGSDATNTGCNSLKQISNLFFSTDVGSTNRLLDNHSVHEPSAFQCIQIIQSLATLMSDQLPVEFEESLGNLLCRCPFTYLPRSLPSDEPFFAFWGHSVPDLVSASVNAATTIAKGTCAISLDMSNSSKSYLSSVKYTHIIAQRYNPSVGNSSNEVSTESASVHSMGYIPYKLLSSLPLDIQSKTSLAYAALNFVSFNSAPNLAQHNLNATHFVSRIVNETDGISDVTFDVDFDSAALSSWLNDLVVRGADMFNTSEGRRSISVEHRKLRLSELSLNVVDSADKKTNSKNDLVAVMQTMSPTVLPTVAPTLAPVSSDGASMGSAIVHEDESNQQVMPTTSAVVDQNATSIAPSADAVSSIDSTNGLRVDANSSTSLLETATTTTTTTRRLAGLYSKTSSSASELSVDKLIPFSLMLELPSQVTDGDRSDEDVRQAISELDEKYKVKVSTSTSTSSSSSSSNAYGGYTLSSTSLSLQRLLHEKEDYAYHMWMHRLKARREEDSMSGLETIRSARLVYILGRHVTLLSIKLSKLMTADKVSVRSNKMTTHADSSGLLVSLLFDDQSHASHEHLLRMLGLKNNIVCLPEWSSFSALSALLATPERAEFAVIQADVVVRVLGMALTSSSGLNGQCEDVALLTEETLSAILLMADITYVEIPSPAVLRYLLQRIDATSPCVDYLSARYSARGSLLALVASQSAPGAHIRVDPLEFYANESKSFSATEIFVVHVSFDSSVQSGSLEVDDHFNKQVDHKASFGDKGAEFGLSVYSALQFGFADFQKRVLLNMLVNLPVWSTSAHAKVSDFVPWKLFLRLSKSKESGKADWSLWYHDIDRENMRTVSGSVSVSRHAASVSARLSREEHSAKGSSLGISVSVGNDGTSASDRNQGLPVWRALQQELRTHSGELAGGKFSFVEHNSGFGYVSTRLAKEFPNATVISLERSETKVQHHVALVGKLGVHNNAVCQKTADDSVIHKNLYESPELFRFQMRSHSLMEDFVSAPSVDSWGESIGTLLSTALTTFIYAPSSIQVSWAMYLVFSEVYEPSRDCGEGIPCIARYVTTGPSRSLSQVLGRDDGMSAESERAADLSDILSRKHPQVAYRNFESVWLLENARVAGGQTTVIVSALSEQDHDSRGQIDSKVDSSKRRAMRQLSLPLVRCDLVNMTRHVHHHYEYSRDGHSRTYTMRVQVNETLSDIVLSRLGDPSQSTSRQLEDGIMLSTSTVLKHYKEPTDISDQNTGVVPIFVDDANSIRLPLGNHPNQHKTVSVHLLRDRDSFPIPYTSIYGVTLITALRLGLETSQREAMFAQFLNLPLYEDMAPWNVVLMGQSLDYIDYDTRQITYGLDVPKAYRVMSVLMNYKRTVEDFKRCGAKAGTVYGLPYVSDCVGTVDKSLVCSELALPVPCGDGQCHSDYISCLRSLSYQAEELAKIEAQSTALIDSKHSLDISLDSNLAAAMKAVVGRFDSKTFASLGYEEFERRLRLTADGK